MAILETRGLATQHMTRTLAVANTARKNATLEVVARIIEAWQREILTADAVDLEAAIAAGPRPALLDWLALDEGCIAGVVGGVWQVTALPDSIGTVTRMGTQPNGLAIGKRQVPLGVIDTIYEARPNVMVDAVALYFKPSNAALLRGGKEAFRSNQAFIAVLRGTLEKTGLPQDYVAPVTDTSRESVNELMGLTEYLDVLIPRSRVGLIRSVVENTQVSIIQTGMGVCRIYVHERVDLDMAARILYNAKTSCLLVCNATECVLVDRAAARDFLPPTWELPQTKDVGPRGCPEIRTILGDWVKPATEAGQDTEFGNYVLVVKVVSDFDEAADFIAAHGTGHSEAIVITDYSAAQCFLDEVDTATVYVNASTHFTSGFEFSLGAGIGVSAQKMHIWGPIGLEELTNSKYITYDAGRVR